MSRQDYVAARTLAQSGWTINALLWALIPRCNTKQKAAIKKAWPEEYAEFEERLANSGFSAEESESRDRAPKGHSF